MKHAKLARMDARRVPCPACGAPALQRCVGARGKLRESNHQERVNVAAQQRPRKRGRFERTVEPE